MPTFVSDKAKWFAAKETVNLVNNSDKEIKSSYIFGTKKEGVAEPKEPFIYRGPDREALKMLEESGADHLGMDFRKDPEFRQTIRNQGFQDTEEYLKDIGYDEEADAKKFKERASVVSAHEIPKRVKEIKIMGGGRDQTGNVENDTIGGFGDERQRKPEELKVGKK